MGIGPGTVIDRYTVESVLGEGGMAVVYKVRHNTLGSLHALKVLSITSPELKKRLVQEGRVQGQLRHPNVVQVTDVVEIGDAPALVMEFIEGPTLDDYVLQQRPTLAQVDALAQGILDGVAAAHAKGLVHRDLKPGNILLQVSPSGLTPKITDFGLAKVQSGEPGGWMRTREGTAMGTPHYMSPEQIRDAAAVGAPGDVFALGAILYELVTGKLAFDGPDMLEIFNRVAHARYTPVRELAPDLPERMERAIVGALKEAIPDRIGTVAELRAVWNGERRTPWDPKTLGEVVAMVPPAARSKTNFSLAPLTRYTAGTLVGGGFLVAVASLLVGSLAFAAALAFGLSSLGSEADDAAPSPSPAVVAAADDAETSTDDLPFVGPLQAGPASSEGAPLEAPAPTDAAAPVASKPHDPWKSGPAPVPAAAAPGRSLDELADDPKATWAIGDLMKNDPDPGVRKKAFRTLVERSDAGVGPAAETGLLLGWMARNGAPDQRIEACAALGRKGTGLGDLAPALNYSASNVRRAAIDAIVAVAVRTGQQGAARQMLQSRLSAEADPKTVRRLTDAIAGL